jgi:hypothetical protein
MVYRSAQTSMDIMEKIAKAVNSNSLYEGLTMEEQAYMRMLLKDKSVRELSIDRVRKIAIAKARKERRNDILAVIKFGTVLLLGSGMFFSVLFLLSSLAALSK